MFTLNSYKYTAAKIQEFEEDIGWSSYFDAYDGRPNTTPITLTQITTTNTLNPQASIVKQILYDMAHSPDDFPKMKRRGLTIRRTNRFVSAASAKSMVGIVYFSLYAQIKSLIIFKAPKKQK